MYKLSLPSTMVKTLWTLREYCAKGPIAKQVREAISQYITTEESKIGCPVDDLKIAIDAHQQDEEKKHNPKEDYVF